MTAQEKDQIIVERIKLASEYMNKPNPLTYKNIQVIDKKLDDYYNTRNKKPIK